MREISRALSQIAEIHGHLARAEVYRGWRPVPVAVSGAIGLVAAASQSPASHPFDAWTFTGYWMGVACLALVVGSAELIWHVATRATVAERRRAGVVVGQFLPALIAGGLVTLALLRLSPSLVVLFPGLWAVFFGVAIFAARPYFIPAAGWIALYFWTVGLLLLWQVQDVGQLSPWSVGVPFAVGQGLGAIALYIQERKRLPSEST